MSPCGDRTITSIGTVALIGAGALGSAILEGLWLKASFKPQELLIYEPNPGPASLKWAEAGALLNSDCSLLNSASQVILAVKPQVFEALGAELAPHLSPAAIRVSVMAGIRSARIIDILGQSPVVRAMPTTALAVAEGVVSLYSADQAALKAVIDLFSSIATCVVLDHEADMDAATAVSGSGAAYVYALVAALEKAALDQGIGAEAARQLARQTLIASAALLKGSETEVESLISRITSPKGTTEAGLAVLRAPGQGLDELITETVRAAAKRSREIAG